MRKDILTVVMDIDGVMADYEHEFCQAFGYDHRNLVDLAARYVSRYAEAKEWLDDRNVYKNLLPIFPGLDINHWLTDRMSDRRPRAIVKVVTGRPLNTKRITEAWLHNNEVRFDELIVASAMKQNIIKDLKPDIIIDDIIGVCQQAYNDIPNVQCVLMAQPWNERDIFFPHITTLTKFQTIYEDVAREKLLSDSVGVRMAPYLSNIT
jgi:uncharacterized HAD superfamily protein